jgi:hypothetical protein
MSSLDQLRERYFSFVSLVARRLQSLGREPADVLIMSPELFELAAVTIPGQPVMFAMYVQPTLERDGAIELLAERFVGGWLRQIAIDEGRLAQAIPADLEHAAKKASGDTQSARFLTSPAGP